MTKRERGRERKYFRPCSLIAFTALTIRDDRQTDRQTETETDIEKQRQRDRDRETETERLRHRGTEREREKEKTGTWFYANPHHRLPST